jgi:hypothetical protein
VVILSLDADKFSKPESLSDLDYNYSPNLINGISAIWRPIIFIWVKRHFINLPGTLKIFDYQYWNELKDKSESFPLYT